MHVQLGILSTVHIQPTQLIQHNAFSYTCILLKIQ